jgi:hypothetical protein
MEHTLSDNHVVFSNIFLYGADSIGQLCCFLELVSSMKQTPSDICDMILLWCKHYETIMLACFFYGADAI